MKEDVASTLDMMKALIKNNEKGEEEAISYGIPQVIHFIWAGGQKLLPFESIDVILSWGNKNRDWTIFLWVDHKTYDGNLQEEYQKLFDDRVKNIQESSEKEEVNAADEEFHFKKVIILDKNNSTSNPINNNIVVYLKDIRLENMIDKNIEYEIDKLMPNFGASSDILRYRIIYEYGGAYFDTDVAPGKNNLSKLNLTPGIHTLYVEHCTQNLNPTEEQLKNFSMDHIGNDTFISTKNNPLMKKLYKKTCDNYDLKSTEDMKYFIQYAHEHVRNKTIRLTGPHLVRTVINENLKYDLSAPRKRHSASSWECCRENADPAYFVPSLGYIAVMQ